MRFNNVSSKLWLVQSIRCILCTNLIPLCSCRAHPMGAHTALSQYPIVLSGLFLFSLCFVFMGFFCHLLLAYFVKSKETGCFVRYLFYRLHFVTAFSVPIPSLFISPFSSTRATPFFCATLFCGTFFLARVRAPPSTCNSGKPFFYA